MRAINHALTGAVIGLAIHQPLIAPISAVASHYLCDMLPHFGRNREDTEELKSIFFRNLLYLDALMCGILVSAIAYIHPVYWKQAVLCAFLAAAPDFLSAPKYFTVRRNKKWKPSLYSRFASSIQWFERPIGAFVEIAWFVAGLTLIIPCVM
ncbi:MAG: hypothetical protein QFB86_03635 [Patescibacteria group bacterium]|nr:hypothetical protein [Patescibacteria group bacterium]